jgi:hypothetical protein
LLGNSFAPNGYKGNLQTHLLGNSERMLAISEQTTINYADSQARKGNLVGHLIQEDFPAIPLCSRPRFGDAGSGETPASRLNGDAATGIGMTAHGAKPAGAYILSDVGGRGGVRRKPAALVCQRRPRIVAHSRDPFVHNGLWSGFGWCANTFRSRLYIGSAGLSKQSKEMTLFQ